MSQNLVLFAWKKTRCLVRVLAALEQCRGIERWPAQIFVDGEGDSKVLEIFGRWKHPIASITSRGAKIGCSGNITLGLQSVFEHAETDRIIIIEDDVLVAPDAIEWLEARLEDQHANPEVMSVGLWKHNDPEAWLPDKGPKPDGVEQGFKAVLGFHCWGWATWQNRWEPFFKKALFPVEGDAPGKSWDTKLNAYAEKHNWKVTLPHISRAQNIGDEHQTHIGSIILPYWTGPKI